MFAVIIIQEIYGKGEAIKHNFKGPIFLIFTGVFLSMIIARAYHNQNYALTIWAQRDMYFYLFYFFLHFLKPDIKDLEKIVLTLGILYAFSYLIQYTIYPVTIFDVRQDVDRGTIRIFIPGGAFMILSLFICLQRFYIRNELRNIFLVLLFLGVVVLTGTRSSLAGMVLVIFYSLVFSRTIRSKYVIYALLVLSLIPIYFLFHDIFIGLMETSVRESQNFQSNIRIRAAKFFLTEFFPNTLAYIFGNGQDHMGSVYGLRVYSYKIFQGFYQSDIGLIGEFSKFGLFYAIGIFWVFFKVFTTRINPEYSYIKYYFLRTFILLFLGTTFTSPPSIATYCIMLYIIDKSMIELKAENHKKEVKVVDEAGPG